VERQEEDSGRERRELGINALRENHPEISKPAKIMLRHPPATTIDFGKETFAANVSDKHITWTKYQSPHLYISMFSAVRARSKHKRLILSCASSQTSRVWNMEPLPDAKGCNDQSHDVSPSSCSKNGGRDLMCFAGVLRTFNSSVSCASKSRYQHTC
jgi:hypothetical protein